MGSGQISERPLYWPGEFLQSEYLELLLHSKNQVGAKCEQKFAFDIYESSLFYHTFLLYEGKPM